MAARFFGQFLLSRGRITGEDLVRAITYQRRRNLRAGERAVKLGMLTLQQERWVSLEQRRSAKSFEELARGRGWLTEEQLSALQTAQAREHLRVGEILVVQGALTAAQLQEELAAFQRDVAPETLVPATPQEQVLADLAECTLLALGRTASVTGKVGRANTAVSDEGTYVESRLALDGDVEANFELRLPRSLALWVARGILDGTPASDDDVGDAVGEFTNLVAGAFCSKMSDAGRTVQASVPTFAMTPPPGQALRGVVRLACPLYTTEGDMLVVLEMQN